MDKALFTNVFQENAPQADEPPLVAPRPQGAPLPAKFKRGDRVRCERVAPSRGSWPQYAGREGTVRVPDNFGEVGIIFGSDTHHGEPCTWFLPSELVKIPKPKP